jgi:hypothetical protein
MLAPPGTLLMYHAATFHRLQVNRSTQARIGVLQSFVPNFLEDPTRLESDDDGGARAVLCGWLAEGETARQHSYARFVASAPYYRSGLTERERRDLEQVWVGGPGLVCNL